MNAVGIDVSKGKSMVAIMRPFGEIVSTPFEIKHTASDIRSLVELINSVEGESRIVMEHTGRYYEVLAHQLSEANLFVSAINPKLIKDLSVYTSDSKEDNLSKPYLSVFDHEFFLHIRGILTNCCSSSNFHLQNKVYNLIEPII